MRGDYLRLPICGKGNKAHGGCNVKDGVFDGAFMKAEKACDHKVAGFL
jgi:hypothetical protein